eukprot:8628905-Ditylum_brightwellii.AAC.1
MDALVRKDVVTDIYPKYQRIPHISNEVASILGEVSLLYNSLTLHQLLSEKGEISQISCALGSTMVSKESILIDCWDFSDTESVTSANSIHTMDDDMVKELYNEEISGKNDLD